VIQASERWSGKGEGPISPAEVLQGVLDQSGECHVPIDGAKLIDALYKNGFGLVRTKPHVEPTRYEKGKA
jgi:hypothetical protein